MALPVDGTERIGIDIAASQAERRLRERIGTGGERPATIGNCCVEGNMRSIRQRSYGPRCAGKEEILALSSQQAAALKEKLRTDTAVDKHSIKDILEVLLRQAEAFRGVLGTKK